MERDVDDELLTVPEIANRFEMSVLSARTLARDVVPDADGRYWYSEVNCAYLKLTSGLPVYDPKMGEAYTAWVLSEHIKRGYLTVKNWIKKGVLKPVAWPRHDRRSRLYLLSDAVRISHSYGRQEREEKRNGGDRPLDPNPTLIPPGPGRVELYRWRHANGFAIFNPLDAKE